MKKLLRWLLVLIVLFAPGTYLFIPSVIRIAGSVIVPANDAGVERVVIQDSQWGRWWSPGKQDPGAPNKEGFEAGGYRFKQTGRFYKSTEISISNAEHSLPSKLVIVSLGTDSTGIEWHCDLSTGNDPLSRLLRYREARRIKNTVDEVLNNLKTFLSRTENVYGIAIERTQLKDTLYVSSKLQLNNYPGVKDIYALIGRIHVYMAKNNCPVTGSPIYNITRMDQEQYQLMAAVPTSKMLKESEGFAMKNMIKGSFMITEVVGGEKKVEEAWHNLKQYFQDYRKTSMAMNFTMLVTDRALQPDSSKWVTKLYMPVY